MTERSGTLSLFDATMLVMGGIIGVGIFFKPHEVALGVPEIGPFFGVWVLGFLAALAGAMTFAELAGTFPRTGGWYVFLREGFGALPAFLFAWVVLLVISTGACAGVAEFGAAQIETLLDLTPDTGRRRALAAGLVVAISGFALSGVKASAVFQNVCMVAKLLAIAVFVLAGLALFSGPAVGDLPPVVPDAGLPQRMVRGMLPVLFTLGGWQLVTYVAPHVRDPDRTLPKAIVLGVGGVAVTYLLLNAAYVRVLGMGTLTREADFAQLLAQHTLGDYGARFFAGVIAISTIGFLVATIFTTPWIYVAMSREGLFLRAVGRTSSRTGAPAVALLVQMGVCLMYLAVAGDVRDDLGDSVVFVEWIFHGLVGVALLRLRRRRPDLPRPFTSPAFPVFPVIYILVATGVVVGNTILEERSVTLLGIGVLAAGAVVYVPWRRMTRPS